MEIIADALLIAGAAGAALYCRVLANRLNALKNLDTGLGAAIASLSRQVDEMRVSLETAKSASGDQTRALTQLTARGEMAAGRLELLLAALHENGRKKSINLRDPGGKRFATVSDDAENDEGESGTLTPFAQPGASQGTGPLMKVVSTSPETPGGGDAAAGEPGSASGNSDKKAEEPEIEAAPVLRWSAAP